MPNIIAKIKNIYLRKPSIIKQELSKATENDQFQFSIIDPDEHYSLWQRIKLKWRQYFSKIDSKQNAQWEWLSQSLEEYGEQQSYLTQIYRTLQQQAGVIVLTDELMKLPQALQERLMKMFMTLAHEYGFSVLIIAARPSRVWGEVDRIASIYKGKVNYAQKIFVPRAGGRFRGNAKSGRGPNSPQRQAG